MQLFLKKNIFLFFWIVASVGTLSQCFNSGNLYFFIKPLLLPSLIAAVILNTGPTRSRHIVIAALFFSFLGDVFLLFEYMGPLFFIIGLICFLLTHVLYCWYFLQIRKTGISLLKQKPWIILAVVLYTGCLLWLLLPTLGDLTVPVIIYACILTTMVVCCFRGYNFINRASRTLFVPGVICFVASDSLLAINKFYTAFSSAAFFITLTYCLAQYLIVRGFIKSI